MSRTSTHLDVGADVLDDFPEQLPEEARQQGPAQVQPLGRVVVAVVLGAAPQRHQQQPVHDVAQEERLPGKGCWQSTNDLSWHHHEAAYGGDHSMGTSKVLPLRVNTRLTQHVGSLLGRDRQCLKIWDFYEAATNKARAFLVSQPGAMPTWGSISFCRMSRAYSSRLARVTPTLDPRLPM